MIRMGKRLAALEARRRSRKRGKGHWLIRAPGQSAEDALAAYGSVAEGDTILIWGAAV